MPSTRPNRLNAECREAIRSIANGEDYNVRDVVMQDLMEWGFVKRDPTNGDRVLTNRGSQEHQAIMASGDGPEDLKQLFGH